MEQGSELISVVVPTVPGREEWLEKCVARYEKNTAGAEIIVVRDQPTCAEAWERGFEQSAGDYVHFTADDIVPVRGWWKDAVKYLDRGVIPVGVVFEEGRKFFSETPMGPKIMIPFLTREMLNQGDWFLPIHHGSDDWITYRAAQLGLPRLYCSSYAVHHYMAPQGRVPERRSRDLKTLAEAMRAAGNIPRYYAWQAERR